MPWTDHHLGVAEAIKVLECIKEYQSYCLLSKQS